MRHDRIDAETRALRRGFDPAGAAGLVIETLAARPWSSATFTGSRRTLRLCFAGDRGDARAAQVAAALPDLEFDLPRAFVAEAVLCEIAAPGELIVELLLLDAA